MVLLIAATATFAQTTAATLSGTVEDEKGAVIPGVKITVANPATGLERTVQTDKSGAYVIPLLPPGAYTVTAEQTGFKRVQYPNIVLNVNDQKGLRIQLAVGAVEAAIEVKSDESLIDISPSVGTTVDRTFVQNLPLNGRTFQSLILLTPGVVQTVGQAGEFSVNGQRSTENYFTVDGVSANVPVDLTGNFPTQTQAGTVPARTASGLTQNLVTIDALEEFKIQTSSYTAELGRQPGGQVQLVTRSGSNQFHGSVFDYVRNEAFEANDWFANSNRVARAPLRQQMFGGSFGGPVYLPRFGEGGSKLYNGKNRTFFFFSYEGLRLRLPKTINTLVPSLQLRATAHPTLQPLLNAYSLPTNPTEESPGVARFFAQVSDPRRHDSTSLRIDQKIGGKLEVFGRFSRTPSESVSRGLGSLVGDRSYTRTLTFGANSVLTGSITSETRFNHTLTRGRNGTVRDTFGGAVPITAAQLATGYAGDLRVQGSFILSLTGVNTSISVGDSMDHFNEQYNTVQNFSWTKRSHVFKFGFDHRRLLPIYGPVPYSQQITVSNPTGNNFANIRNGIAASVAVFAKQETHPIFDNISAYGQDTWKVTPHLTLDLGLRWELNPAPDEKNGLKPVLITGVDNLPTATIAPAGSTLYNTFYGGFAPRFGAAYQLFRKPGQETVIRGAFGFYYSMGNSMATTGFSTFPFSTTKLLTNVQLPLTAAQAETIPFSTLTLPTTQSLRAINPDLVLPYTMEWNLAVERSLGTHQTISVSYVASASRRLLAAKTTNQALINPVTGATLPRPNPNFSNISYIFNGPTADYNSLQAQFQRRLSKGLQALVAYTWAHAIDEVSSEDSTGVMERGNSAVDIRHNLTAGVTYNLPKLDLGPILSPITRGWSIDTIFLARTGPPIDLRSSSGRQILDDGTLIFSRPDYIEGQPHWVADPTAPGGTRLNVAAFSAVPPIVTNGIFLSRQGNLARNAVHSKGFNTVNMSLRRKFSVTEKVSLSLTAEAYNLFNHPAFGPPGTGTVTISSTYTPAALAAFGKSTSMLNRFTGSGLSSLYQTGGPRSMQFSARIAF